MVNLLTADDGEMVLSYRGSSFSHRQNHQK